MHRKNKSNKQERYNSTDGRKQSHKVKLIGINLSICRTLLYSVDLILFCYLSSLSNAILICDNFSSSTSNKPKIKPKLKPIKTAVATTKLT